MADPSADRPRPSPLALGLAVAVFLVAAVGIPLIPEQVRPWNFAAFGAIALFVAARGGRFGLTAALVLALGTKLASDLLNYRAHGYDAEYLPFTAPAFGLAVYGGLAAYAVLGWGLLRRSGNPARVGGVAACGSMLFYLITNFASWLHQDLPYPQTAVGLVESYWLGLPFFRGTLIGDLTFTGLLFGLYAVVSALTVSRQQSEPKPLLLPVSCELPSDTRSDR